MGLGRLEENLVTAGRLDMIDRMSPRSLVLRWCGRLFELRHVFGRFLVEVLAAGLAAELNFLSFISEDYGLAHAAEFFTGNDAGGEGVSGGAGFCIASDQGEPEECTEES